MFNFTIQRSSSAINGITCQLLTGFVLVNFKNGRTYAYSNVSKRAILNLYLNQNMSLGFWVNENCINATNVKYADVYRFVYNHTFA